MKFIEKIKLFLKEVFLEAKKINWLSRKELFKYTIVVLSVSIAIALFLGGLDYIFSSIIKRLLI